VSCLTVIGCAMVRERLVVYIPLFAAAVGSGRLLSLGFESPGCGWRGDRCALGGALSQVLHRTSRLMDLRPSLSAVERRSNPLIYPLEPLPALTAVEGAGLGLALGISLYGSSNREPRLFAFGCLTAGTSGIGVEPLRNPAPILRVLEGLGRQPRPLCCIIPTFGDRGTHLVHCLSELEDANIHCHLVSSLEDALCIQSGTAAAVHSQRR